MRSLQARAQDRGVLTKQKPVRSLKSTSQGSSRRSRRSLLAFREGKSEEEARRIDLGLAGWLGWLAWAGKGEARKQASRRGKLRIRCKKT